MLRRFIRKPLGLLAYRCDCGVVSVGAGGLLFIAIVLVWESVGFHFNCLFGSGTSQSNFGVNTRWLALHERKDERIQLLIYTAVGSDDSDESVDRLTANRDGYRRRMNGNINDPKKMNTSVLYLIDPIGKQESHCADKSWAALFNYPRMNHMDYVWFLDRDAYFVSSARTGIWEIIEDVQRKQKDRCQIFVSRDCFGVNGGSIVLRSSKWTDDFVKKWVSLVHMKALRCVLREGAQAALKYLLSVDYRSSQLYTCIMNSSSSINLSPFFESSCPLSAAENSEDTKFIPGKDILVRLSSDNWAADNLQVIQ